MSLEWYHNIFASVCSSSLIVHLFFLLRGAMVWQCTFHRCCVPMSWLIEAES